MLIPHANCTLSVTWRLCWGWVDLRLKGCSWDFRVGGFIGTKLQSTYDRVSRPAWTRSSPSLSFDWARGERSWRPQRKWVALLVYRENCKCGQKKQLLCLNWEESEAQSANVWCSRWDWRWPMRPDFLNLTTIQDSTFTNFSLSKKKTPLLRGSLSEYTETQPKLRLGGWWAMLLPPKVAEWEEPSLHLSAAIETSSVKFFSMGISTTNTCVHTHKHTHFHQTCG